jgi:hypothetical protein
MEPVEKKQDFVGEGQERTVDLREGQNHLSEEQPTVFEKKTVTPPNWGERLATGAKVAGLVLGATVCGALAVGLFPATIIGGALWLAGMAKGMKYMDHQDVVEGTASDKKMEKVAQSEIKGKRLMLAGEIFAAPVVGLNACVNEISLSLAKPDSRKSIELAEAAIRFVAVDADHSKKFLDTFNTSIFFGGFSQRDLEQIYNDIVDLDPESIKKEIPPEALKGKNYDELAIACKKELLEIVDKAIKGKAPRHVSAIPSETSTTAPISGVARSVMTGAEPKGQVGKEIKKREGQI